MDSFLDYIKNDYVLHVSVIREIRIYMHTKHKKGILDEKKAIEKIRKEIHSISGEYNLKYGYNIKLKKQDKIDIATHIYKWILDSFNRP